MANKVQKPCKTCGKMFTPCADCENDKSIFHWRRVACSPECAKEYFAKIEASRKAKNTESQPMEMDTAATIDTAPETTTRNITPKKTRKKEYLK